MAIIDDNDEGHILTGTGEDDTINGNGGNDKLYGSYGDDLLYGGDGDDLLDGGYGNDILRGGDGSDTYIINDGGDEIIEDAGANGTDWVYSSLAAYTLDANIENGGVSTWDGASLTGNALNNVLIGWIGSDVLNGGDGNDTLSGGGANDTLSGGDGNDQLDGGEAYDTLIGGAGNDTLDGGTWSDFLQGGAGNDVYLFGRDNAIPAIDTISDGDATAGNVDTIRFANDISPSDVYCWRDQSSLHFQFTDGTDDRLMVLNFYTDPSAQIERVEFADGTVWTADTLRENAVFYGTEDVDTLNGLEQADTIKGRGQDDTLNGNGGDDKLYGEAGNDILNGGTGNDTLYGGVWYDTLNGGDGNDTLDGGTEGDTLNGGDGNDTYYVDNGGDAVSETNSDASTGGTDQVNSYLGGYTLGANVENGRILSSGAANLTGNTLNNVLYAGAGDNLLDGATGIDTGSYEYATAAVTVSLDSTAAQATGGSGSDTLTGIENLTGSNYNDSLTGNADNNVLNGGTGGDDILAGLGGNDTLHGLAGDDTLDGGAGDDILYGGLGADNMTGGDGSDSYYVDNTNDVVNETGSGGTDRVNSYLSDYTLGANVENGRILSSGTASLIGNTLNNVLYAGEGNNELDGAAGNDTVSYKYAAHAVTVRLDSTAAQDTDGSGSDTLLDIENLTGSDYNDNLTGNASANWLTGGLGADTLTGGAGADRFNFNSLSELGLTNTDTIMDFRGYGEDNDRIDLAGIDANTALAGDQAFTFLGTASAFTGDATGQLRFDAQSNTLYGSTDADTDAEFAIVLTGVTSLRVEDFVL